MKRCLDSCFGRVFAGLAGVASALALAGFGDQTDDRATMTPSTEVAAVDTPKPAYPMELACAGVGGEVALNVTVGVDGKPSSVRLVNTSGNEALEHLALEGVKGWLFKPATRNGQPYAQAIQVPVNFKVPQLRPDECFALDAKN